MPLRQEIQQRERIHTNLSFSTPGYEYIVTEFPHDMSMSLIVTVVLEQGTRLARCRGQAPLIGQRYCLRTRINLLSTESRLEHFSIKRFFG